MKGQCPSCGGDCGHTKAKGCRYGVNPVAYSQGYQQGRADETDGVGWVGLTDDERKDILHEIDPLTVRLPLGFKRFAEGVETKLKEKNT